MKVYIPYMEIYSLINLIVPGFLISCFESIPVKYIYLVILKWERCLEN